MGMTENLKESLFSFNIFNTIREILPKHVRFEGHFCKITLYLPKGVNLNCSGKLLDFLVTGTSNCQY